MKFEVRRGTRKDAEAIVRLFSEGGNPHNWSVEKWQHYYQDYPEGEAIIFVAESDQGIIGHYSLFPVIIGGRQVYMGAHAYVSESVRGLAVISRLMKAFDDFCISNGVPFVVGFANARFTTVKNKLFKWKIPFYANFLSAQQFDPEIFKDRPLRFQYTEKWQRWRFGIPSGPIVSKYEKAKSEKPVYQLLHTERKVNAPDFGILTFECWSPEGYQTAQGAIFAQPFSIKIFDKTWDGPDLLDLQNWFIQMGDSDTFVFTEI